MAHGLAGRRQSSFFAAPRGGAPSLSEAAPICMRPATEAEALIFSRRLVLSSDSKQQT